MNETTGTYEPTAEDVAWVNAMIDEARERTFAELESGELVDGPDGEDADWDGEDAEPVEYGMDNYLEDAEALASAGWGTDEDYGYDGGWDD